MLKKVWSELVREFRYRKEVFMLRHFPRCQECGAKLNKKDEYQMKYGFCNVHCGYKLFGLSPRDFY